MTARPRLLLICPRFFGYEDEIAAAFTRRGFDVTYVDERPANDSLSKAVFRVAPALLRRSVDRHFRGVPTSGFERVVVVKGEVVPRWFLEAVRRDSPDASLSFYTFDSVANSSALAGIVDLFDVAFGFEHGATIAGVDLVYKPLFYSTPFGGPGGQGDRYDLAFVGTLHSDRYRFVRRVRERFPRSFVHLYSQARWYLGLQRLRDRRLRGLTADEVHFEKLATPAVAEIFRSSRAVLDMQHDQQSGLTMRTFEVLATGARLVTTNPLAAAELGETGRVLVVAPEPSDADLDRIAEFIAPPRPAGMPAGFERHSVDAWIADLVDVPR